MVVTEQSASETTMSEQASIEDESGGEGDRTRLSFDAVRVGDSVVWTSSLNKEYRFTVAAVDSTWLTFRTGQMVHKDRFDREDFAVVRADRTTALTAETDDRTADSGEEPTAGDGPAVEGTGGMQASMSDTD